MENTTPPANTERQQTNSSLVAERGRTDEAFKRQTKSLESETDSILDNGRSKADKIRLERRAEVDEKIGADNDCGPNLLNERREEDLAIENERHAADLAFEHERSQRKSSLSQLLEQARDATDKDLLEERTRTDFETLQSTNLLTAEQLAHTTTRAALTTREEFLAIVSHDLRNPIGAISSFADILLEDPSLALASNEVRRWIEFMKRNADTSLRLISDILDMERISEGKLDLKIGTHSLADLAREAVEDNTQIALSKLILLKVNQRMSPAVYEFDKDRITQVLSNLIGNALKFCREGNTVTVNILDKETEVEVSVQDTGPGIADDKKSLIFERFAQIQNKDRRGLGLGLYISKTFVELHGGRMWVCSALGQGSTFYFTLPK